MPCVYTSGALDYTCADKKKLLGGVVRAWVGNLSSLATPVAFPDPITDISALSFNPGEGLYAIEQGTEAINVIITPVVTDSGVIYYEHRVQIKFTAERSATRDKVEKVSASDDLFFIAQRNSGVFEALALQNGMKPDTEQVATEVGFAASGTELKRQRNFVSLIERHDARIFFNTSEATTLTTLRGYEV